MSFIIRFPRDAAAVICCCLLSLTSGAYPVQAQDQPAPASAESTETRAQQASPPVEPEPTFEINEFRIEGNTLISTEKLDEQVDEFIGNDRTAADVEKARDALERFYHDGGYPTVVVNIPEQSAEGGNIRLQVIEGRIGADRVKGNRYFPTSEILRLLPSLSPGTVLYAPAVQEEVGRVNRNPDLKVIPSMAPGKEPGTVDVDLKVDDKLPFHGFLELNNRNSPNTTELRLNGGLHYDNLWNRLHSISFQYQVSPQNPDEVEVFSGSYTIPAPWNPDQSLVVYGVSSDSRTAFGEGFHTTGKGSIIGTRWIAPLPAVGSVNHTAVVGFDYKNFHELTGTTGSGDSDAPVEYLPLSISYSASRPDSQGLTILNAGLNLSFRGAVAQEGTFESKRYMARGNYVTATMGLERHQELPGKAGFLLKMDGQMADQPLISNEQYAAGGMESVRGYRESTLLGDNAFHATAELSAPDLAPRLKLGERFQVLLYLFYDCAALWTKYPLPGQDSSADLQSTGVGVRGFLFKDLEYEVDWAYALSDTSDVKTGDTMLQFKVKYQF